MSAQSENRPSDPMPDAARFSLPITFVLAGAALGISALAESAATASADNCGELPGITRTLTMMLGVGIAIGIAIVGAIGAAIVRRGSVFGAAVVIACGIVLGLFIGAALTPRNPCNSGQERPTRQVATLVLTLGAPYATRVEGPGECRRPAPGADVREVVSDLAAHSSWLIDNGAVRVDVEVYPAGGSTYPGADYLRVFLSRPGSGFGIYADGDGTDLADVVITAPGNGGGRIAFGVLPPWTDNEPAPSLPARLNGTIQWACSGPEA